MQITYVLVGPHANKTIKLGGHQFKSGRHATSIQGAQVEGYSKLMSFYQAYPEGSKELADAQAYHAELRGEKKKNDGSKVHTQEGSDDGAVGEGEPSSTQEPSGPGYAEVEAAGEGVQDPDVGGREEAPVNEKLRSILSSLDPSNDEHWTQAGLPRLTVVEEAYESTNLTRSDIEAALPGWNREVALERRTKELSEI